ncbi:MAG TPA: aminotransferase class V-fold PLP-dependent enzyme [Capillimicrobium sp.]|nr:aminotransferase class V-fold PLP-dependent enzyme [Capillimicrobium sp.]
MDPATLRAAFPVLAGGGAYLNAGTCGPIPGAAADAARAELDALVRDGRAAAAWERMHELQDRQRAAYAARVGAARPEDVALTTATSDGIARVLAGLELRPGDEIVTSDEEHPGLLGPLAAARQARGVRVRAVPFARVAEAVSSATKLVACSHVSWVGGSVAPAELRDVARDVPVLLDGAQGAGAVRVDVSEVGCQFYAAAGQKWLCGPVGTGLLYVAPAWQERLPSIGPTYMNLAEPGLGLDAVPHDDARRYDTPALSAEASAFAIAAHDVIAGFGWDAAVERAAGLAELLAERLRATGRSVAPRGRTTLVAWSEPDAEAVRDRAAAAGVTIRDLPGRGLLRASVGAWNDESDLDRLLAVLP